MELLKKVQMLVLRMKHWREQNQFDEDSSMEGQGQFEKEARLPPVVSKPDISESEETQPHSAPTCSRKLYPCTFRKPPHI